MKKHSTTIVLQRVVAGGIAAATLVGTGAMVAAQQPSPSDTPKTPLVTGKSITPTGDQTDVGSFPVNMVVTANGRFAVLTGSGSREYISVIDTATGKIVSRLDFNAARKDMPKQKLDLYYGLTLGPVAADGSCSVYASRGSENKISVLNLAADGTLTDTNRTINYPGFDTEELRKTPLYPAGLALGGDGTRLFAANNTILAKQNLSSTVSVFDTATGQQRGSIPVDGYPFAVASLTTGPNAGKKVYVTSEQTGKLFVIDALSLQVKSKITVGSHPIGLCFNRAQSQLFVANADSDTVSIVDTVTDKVKRTILLRPTSARSLPGATPTGLALSPDEKRLYVTLADMNAVAVVDLANANVIGYIPVGWYPTAVAVSPDGERLLVANAKGVAERNPNGKPKPGLKERPQYIQNIIEGTVSSLPVPDLAMLARLTQQTLENNRVAQVTNPAPFVNPGIKHVIYIIKENRTYDNVLGDLPQGNGDKSLTLFGRDVTPNQHALAERFVLLDNYYCCAEVSGDGWNWSTAGMANEYVARNVPHGYSSRVRTYDYEGTNNGVAPERKGKIDVATPAGGYIWDVCDKNKVSVRNYGFFVDDFDDPRATPEDGPAGKKQESTKNALVKVTNADFRGFDLRFPDSEAALKHGLANAPEEMKTYGSQNDPARITTWRREFEKYVQKGNLPRFQIVRFGRDHTSGTTAGQRSPRAMVADNDYAVGQLVETVSKSPYWKDTAIFVVEDDAQNGFDHVDAHRSIAFVISPFTRKGTVDSRFYNTDSTLRTMELLLGLPPMNQYDAIAPPFAFFGAQPTNDAPYQATLPAKEIIGEVNKKTAYRAADSKRLISATREESAADEELNDILWHSTKGKSAAKPARRYGVRIVDKAPKRQHDDDD